MYSAVLLVTLLVPTTPLRDLVARRFAPTIYQETLDPVRDFIAAYDFDGDWDGSNNAAHVVDHPLRAVVYYTVVETPTHWFVQYMPYHPVDYKRLSGHIHDTENLLLTIRKRPRGGAELEVMETRFHAVWYQYVAPGVSVGDAADDVDGPIHFDGGTSHPAIYAQRVGHGLCGGFAPTTTWADLQIECDHERAPHLEQRGVVYRYAGQAMTPVTGVAQQVVGYDLVEMATSLWAQGASADAFSRVMTFAGERCGSVPGWTCPRSVGAIFAGQGGSAEAPWAQTPGRGVNALGEQFFDPALTMSRRLSFASPVSLDYSWNPYLGIGSLLHPSTSVARSLH